jgi:hypothetical protein
MDDPRVDVVARALHTFHGLGYCTQGKHFNHLNFHCHDEARAILAALDGRVEAGNYPDSKKNLTLSAREERARRR